MSKGILYLIPTPLGEGDPEAVLPASVLAASISYKISLSTEYKEVEENE